MNKDLELIKKLQIEFQETQKKIAEDELKVKLQKIKTEKEDYDTLKKEMIEEFGAYIEPEKNLQQKKNRRIKYRLQKKLVEQKKLYEQAKLEEIRAYKKLDQELEQEYKQEIEKTQEYFFNQITNINNELKSSLKNILNIRAKIKYLEYLFLNKIQLEKEFDNLLKEEIVLKNKYIELNKQKKNKELQFLMESNLRIKKKAIKEVDDYLTLVKLQELRIEKKEDDE
uniref:Uncharacterized protein orf225 n=1 Tax=Heterostelium pallidum TaxID=13642 RepID=Q5ILI5_HETPA|nr:hypothetical protein PopaoMp41 [Heterostelium pallidum]AAU00625.1 unknown [Heterostelium pallidum]